MRRVRVAADGVAQRPQNQVLIAPKAEQPELDSPPDSPRTAIGVAGPSASRAGWDSESDEGDRESESHKSDKSHKTHEEARIVSRGKSCRVSQSQHTQTVRPLMAWQRRAAALSKPHPE